MSENLRTLVPRVNNTTVSSSFQRYACTLSPFCAANGRNWWGTQSAAGALNSWERPDLVGDAAPDVNAQGYPMGITPEQQLVTTSGLFGDTQFLVFDTGLPFDNAAFAAGYKANNYLINEYFPPAQFSGASFPGLTRVGHSVRSHFCFCQRSHCL